MLEAKNTSQQANKKVKTWFSNEQTFKYMMFIFIIGLLVLIIRYLVSEDLSNTAILYFLIPSVIGVAMALKAGPQPVKKSFHSKMRQDLFWATALMLSTAGVLQEGWICVLMFMPIFYIAWLIGYGFQSFFLYRANKNKIGVFLVPIFVLTLGFEGVFPETTFDRYQIVKYDVITEQNVMTLKKNLSNPLEFTGDRHWLLKVFPLPDAVQANSLNEGDVHKLDFTYWRWVFTHEHKGSLYVKLKVVNDDHIITEITKNTSFYARYIDIKNTRIDFDELENGKTKVTLQIGYERKLDPYWYFGPIQKFAMEKAVEVILNDLILDGQHG